jgi:hypothetical protein
MSHIGGTKCSKIVAGGHHDQSHRSTDGHEQETLCATPDIHHSSQRNIAGGSDRIGDNVDCVEE